MINNIFYIESKVNENYQKEDQEFVVLQKT